MRFLTSTAAATAIFMLAAISGAQAGDPSLPGYIIPAGYETAASGPQKPSDRMSRYRGMVASAARQHGVPIQLALIVAKIESGFNPKARSHANARGIMQILPRTARRMGFNGPTKSLYDPRINVRYAMKYLALCYELARGNWRRTGHCYNGGERRTHAKRLPRETRNYGHLIVAYRDKGFGRHTVDT